MREGSKNEKNYKCQKTGDRATCDCERGRSSEGPVASRNAVGRGSGSGATGRSPRRLRLGGALPLPFQPTGEVGGAAARRMRAAPLLLLRAGRRERAQTASPRTCRLAAFRGSRGGRTVSCLARLHSPCERASRTAGSELSLPERESRSVERRP